MNILGVMITLNDDLAAIKKPDHATIKSRDRTQGRPPTLLVTTIWFSAQASMHRCSRK